jgi:GxxExxY protein
MNISCQNAVILTLRAAARALYNLGPGQTEKTYEILMQKTLYDQHVPVLTQFDTHMRTEQGIIVYTGTCDLFVASNLVVELKARQASIKQDHIDQVMRYRQSIIGLHDNKKDEMVQAMIINFTRMNQHDVMQVWQNTSNDTNTLLVDRSKPNIVVELYNQTCGK